MVGRLETLLYPDLHFPEGIRFPRDCRLPFASCNLDSPLRVQSHRRILSLGLPERMQDYIQSASNTPARR